MDRVEGLKIKNALRKKKKNRTRKKKKKKRKNYMSER